MADLKYNKKVAKMLQQKFRRKSVHFKRMEKAFLLLDPSQKEIDHNLPLYSDDEPEISWQLYFGYVDVEKKNITYEKELKQVASNSDIGNYLPVFVWQAKNEINSLNNQFNKYNLGDKKIIEKFGEPKESFEINLLEAKILVPRGDGQWKILASQTNGKIDNQEFNEFKIINISNYTNIENIFEHIPGSRGIINLAPYDVRGGCQTKSLYIR